MHRRVLILPLLGALALLGLALPARAATSAATAQPTAVTHTATGDKASRERALMAFWTPQRLRDAIPMPTPKSAAQPALPLPNATATGPRTLARPTGAKVAGPENVQPNALSTPSTQGKVYFVDPSDNNTYECSGGSINNPTGDMVITAGHCVYDNGNWMTDWIYIPADFNGPSGYGTWLWNQMTTFQGWMQDANPNYDFGIVNVEPDSAGDTLVDVAGGNGMDYNDPYSEAVVIFGYPGGVTVPIYCYADTFEQNAAEIGAACNMPNGTSGGPWLTDYDSTNGQGYEVGVNSYGVPSDIYSPYFTSAMASLYDETAND